MFAAFATLAVAGCGIIVNLDDGATRRIETDTVSVGGMRALEVTTENGASDNGGVDVNVRTESGSAHRITAQSDNGSIEVRYPTSSASP
jgi:hypothetical protein